MTAFSELGIAPPTKGLIGDKIKIGRVLNKLITVTDYEIKPSKVKPTDKCLHLQFSLGESKHVLFTGSANLIGMMSQVSKSKLPITTTIIEDNDRYLFQ